MMSEADPELRRDTAPQQTYYAEARTWAKDGQAARERSRRFAWGLAAAATTIALLEALALVALAPLKTVVPYTLLVDRNTGFVEALDPTHPLPLKPQAALTEALLAQYVVARESFAVAGLAEQYRKVALWSADTARRDYLGMMTPGNPDNPFSRYPRATVVQAHVESVSPVAADAALVRFYTERSDPDQGARPRAYWVAMLRYRYSGQPMALTDRLVNPLGFQVLAYRRDQEAPPPPESLPPQSLAPEARPVAPTAALPAADAPTPVAPVKARPAYPYPAGQPGRPGVVRTLRR